MDFARARREMVTRDLIGRGIRDPLVLGAMQTVPRERFVPEHLVDLAYEDGPLSIGAGQTISQPYVVAWMIELLGLRGGEKVLEVGAGSGYAAAVLSRIADEVHAIERLPQLADAAAHRMADLGYDNVHIHCGDGARGLAPFAPFGGILVSAGAARRIPPALIEELGTGGRLVAPVEAPGGRQRLVRVTRTSPRTFVEESLGFVSFVPLVESDGPGAAV